MRKRGEKTIVLFAGFGSQRGNKVLETQDNNNKFFVSYLHTGNTMHRNRQITPYF